MKEGLVDLKLELVPLSHVIRRYLNRHFNVTKPYGTELDRQIWCHASQTSAIPQPSVQDVQFFCKPGDLTQMENSPARFDGRPFCLDPRKNMEPVAVPIVVRCFELTTKDK